MIERDREGWGQPAANYKASDWAENPIGGLAGPIHTPRYHRLAVRTLTRNR
jgi:hypothetical protein